MTMCIISLFLFTIIASCVGNVEYDGWLNIQLQHAIGLDGSFTDRGNITIQSLRSGSFSLEQGNLKSVDLKKLQDASKADGFYKLKSIAQSSDGTEAFFLSSIKANTLLENNLHDTITVWVLHNGAVAAVSLSPSMMEVPNYDRTPTQFTSDVYIRQVEQAPVPDTASYIQKMEREREAREKGEFKDNRSFIAKYWMYIVPVVIFVMVSGAANPEQGAAR